MGQDIAPYTVEVLHAHGEWTEQDVVRGWKAASNTAVRALGIYRATRIKDRYGRVVYEGPTESGRQ